MRTFARLIDPLDEEPTAWAECLFVDSVSDLAVLGSSDGQELYEEAEAHEALVEAALPRPLGRLAYTREPVTLAAPTQYRTADPITILIMEDA
jgi:hypothetical protein